LYMKIMVRSTRTSAKMLRKNQRASQVAVHMHWDHGLATTLPVSAIAHVDAGVSSWSDPWCSAPTRPPRSL
jgi:hypothetical protein